MPVTQSWGTPEALQTVTISLNSLAMSSIVIGSTEIDNGVGLYQYLMIELVLGSLTPTGTPMCQLYIQKQVDGTNYEDLTTSSSHAMKTAIPFSTAVAAKRIIVAGIPIDPCKFKLAIQNLAGPSLAGSGNSLKYARYNEIAG